MKWLTIKNGLSSQKKGFRGQERIEGGSEEKDEGEEQMEELDGEDLFLDSPALHPRRLKKLIEIQSCPIKTIIESIKEDWMKETTFLTLFCYTLL